LNGLPATQGFGHSTVMMACEVAASAHTGQLILFHHDPSYTDDVLAGMEQKAKNLFADSITAYEGLEVILTPNHSAIERREWKDVQYAHHG